jgi:cytochrome c peroxidase
VLEMDEQITNVVHKLQRTSKYRQMFHAAWNDSTVTGAHTLQSIGAFLASIVSCNSRYDKMKNGLDTFSGKEQRGYLLFRQHCNSCHTEPLFTNNSFENNGLSIDTTLNDIGRARISLKKDDSFKFKVPTLRNIAFSFPYMHDGRFKTLGQVLNHYSNGVVNSQTLSTSLKHGLQLTSDEKVEIIAFLLTLTDRQFLFDERYGYPVTKVNGQ